MKTTHTKTIWTLLFYLWIIAILVLTSVSFGDGARKQNDGGLRLDYLQHFIVYSGVPVLFFLSRGAGLNRIFRSSYYLLLLGILFCILTEVQQYYIPGRSFNPIDLGLNLAGFFTGLFAGRYISKTLYRNDEK